MKILIEMKMGTTLYLLMQIELKIKIQVIMYWLQYELIKMETLILKMIDLNFQYDFIVKHYFLDVLFHILILIIKRLEQNLEIILHHIQTISTLPWRRYASRWAPTSRMWMLC